MVMGNGQYDEAYGPDGFGNVVVAGTGTGQQINAGGNSTTGNGGGDTYILNGSSELLGDAWQLNNTTVTNLGNANSIDLLDVSSATASVSYTASSGILAVTDGTNMASILLTGQYNAAGFTTESDGSAGTLVAYTPTVTQQYVNPYIAPSHTA